MFFFLKITLCIYFNRTGPIWSKDVENGWGIILQQFIFKRLWMQLPSINLAHGQMRHKNIRISFQ